MKINIYIRAAAAILAVLWMMKIFSYSSEDASTSTEVSRSVSFDIVSSANSILKLGWDEEKLWSEALEIEYKIRKLAHVTEYAILVLLIGVSLDAWRNIENKKNLIRFMRLGTSLCICSVYAVLDEIHQTYVDGRRGEIRDVAIDISGAVAMIAITTIAVMIWNRFIKKDNTKFIN